MPARVAIFVFVFVLLFQACHSVGERPIKGVREVAQMKIDFGAVKERFPECVEKKPLLGCSSRELRSGALPRAAGSEASAEINTAGVRSLTTGMPAV